MGLGTILNDMNAASVEPPQNLRQRSRLPKEMHRNDGTRARTEPTRNLVRVHAKRPGIDIGVDDLGAHLMD